MVRKFKTEKGKTVYAVTGIPVHLLNDPLAINEVIRYRKEALSSDITYFSYEGVIAPYKEGLDGLWLKGRRCPKGERCFIVTKGFML